MTTAKMPPAAMSDLFRVLMHPTRLAILELLRPGEQCVCHLEAYLGKRQAYISQQLMLLRDAGLVADRRDGLNVFYRVTQPQIYTVIDAARTLYPDSVAPVSPLGDGHCTCPQCSPMLVSLT